MVSDSVSDMTDLDAAFSAMLESDESERVEFDRLYQNQLVNKLRLQ